MDTFFSLNPIVCSPLHCIASHHRQDSNMHSIAISKGLVFTGSDSKRTRVWRQFDCTEQGRTKTSSGEIRAILAKFLTKFVKPTHQQLYLNLISTRIG
ncbi:hypothetical protein V6N13_139609 [Hibiscus sabdariffa]